MQRTNFRVERLIWQHVEVELGKARSKFPSADHVVLALAEECGELVKAAMDNLQGKASVWDVYDEAIQVIAMALRVVTEGDPTLKLKPAALDRYPEQVPIMLKPQAD